MRIPSLSLSVLLVASASAQGPAILLKDINPVLSATSPGAVTTPFLTIGAITYFVATDGLGSSTLWKTDGTTAGTQMVRRISVAGSDSIGSMAALNGILYFRATDDINTTNTELWRSDGTAAGTFRVKDINPGPAGSAPYSLTTWNNALWFTADDGVHGRELWKSDGTTAGTVLVEDINPGSASGLATGTQFTGLPNAFNYLFFAADDGVSGLELWRSDGTAAGTALVRDINPGAAASSPAWFEVGPSQVLYFAATTAASGRELWTTTGLSLTTVMVEDINPGTASSNPSSLTLVGSTVYFQANDGTNGAELWASSGSALLTTMVKDINAGNSGSTPTIVAVVGSQMLLLATTSANGRELWRSNGTSAGTALLKDINPGSISTGMTGFTVMGSIVLFTADDTVHGEEPWRTDLTTAGTVLVEDIVAGAGTSNPFMEVAVGSSYALFIANDGVHGQEIWRTNGTIAGTFLLKDCNPRKSSSNPTSFLDSGGLQGVYFAADNGVNGVELWKSDGTTAGTVMIRDINLGSQGSSPTLLGRIGGVAYFSADDGVNGRELWRTDGTLAGTFMVKDIRPGSASSNAGAAQVQSMTVASAVMNGYLYFPADDGVYGSELWRSDGTAAGTVMVRDINPGAAASAPVSMFVLGNTLYMSATEVSMGREIWKSDGSTAGTVLLKGDVNPGIADSCFVYHQFWAYGNRLVCPMRDPVNGYELWMSDGSAAGTVLIKDINPGTSGSSPQDMKELNGILYFVAYEPTAGQELWRTDGTTAGTFLLKDIQPGAGQGVPFSLTRIGNQIVFMADQGPTGWELWRTDGTTVGTVPVKEINPGNGDANTFDLDAIFAPPGAQVAVLAASDGYGGIELWRTDGTAAGTVQHAEINVGAGSSMPSTPVLAGSWLFFTADNGTGRELYAMLTQACAIPYGRGCPGTGGIVPELINRGTPALGNLGYGNLVTRGFPNSTAILFWGIAPAEINVGFGCTLWFDIFQPYFVFTAATNASGTAFVGLPIPNDPSLVGGQGFSQCDVVDPGGSFANIVSITGGLKQVFNTR